MNEAETRAEHIDPALAAAGWGVVEGSRIRREYAITPGRLEGLGRRGKGLTADYVLIYRNTKLATVEAKAWDEPLTAGVGQAKNYLDGEEPQTLNRIVNAYLEFAELQALNRKPMTMADWIIKLDDFLKLTGRELLHHAGKISADDACEKAEAEYARYRKILDSQPRGIDDDLDQATKEIKKLPKPRKPRKPTGGENPA